MSAYLLSAADPSFGADGLSCVGILKDVPEQLRQHFHQGDNAMNGATSDSDGTRLFGGDHPAPDWDLFRNLPEPQPYPGGIDLQRQGSPIDAIYVIRGGLVKLEHVNADGRTAIAGLRSSGSLLGASEAILLKNSATTAKSIVPTIASRIPSPAFRMCVDRDVGLAALVIESLSWDAYIETMQLIGFGCSAAKLRLQHFLSDFAGSVPQIEKFGAKRLRLPITHEELAHLLAVTPAHLSHLLNHLERMGAIERKKGWILWRDSPETTRQ